MRYTGFWGFVLTKARTARTACVAQLHASIVRGSNTCAYSNHSAQASTKLLKTFHILRIIMETWACMWPWHLANLHPTFFSYEPIAHDQPSNKMRITLMHVAMAIATPPLSTSKLFFPFASQWYAVTDKPHEGNPHNVCRTTHVY